MSKNNQKRQLFVIWKPVLPYYESQTVKELPIETSFSDT